MKIFNKRKLQQTATIYSSDVDFKDFMNLFLKNTIDDPYWFLVNNMTMSSDNPLQVTKNLLQKSVLMRKSNQKNHTGRNKGQFNLHREMAKISALSSWNVSKYKFLTHKDVLLEK